MVHLPEDRFHRHSIGQLLGRSLQLLSQEFRAFGLLAAIMVIPTVVFNAMYFARLHKLFESYVKLLQNAAANNNDPYNNKYNGNVEDDLANLQTQFNTMFAKLAWLILIVSLLGTVIKAAMVRTTTQAFVPMPVTVSRNLRHGLDRLFPMIVWGLLYITGLLVYSIVVGIAMVILMMIAISIFGSDIGAVVYVLLQVGNLFLTYYICLVVVFCMPAIVVERVSAWNSFIRAWSMAEGHRCMILCALLTMMTGAAATFGIEYFLFSRLGWTALAAINGLTTAVFWMPLGSILVTLLYLNVRIDKEGMNVQVLKDDLARGDAALGAKETTAVSPLEESLTGPASESSYQPISLEDADKTEMV